MNMKNNVICDHCKDQGVSFRADFIKSPEDYIEGDKKAKIWIVGLNPKLELNTVEKRTKEDLANKDFFKKGKENSYFKNFEKVSKWVYEEWKENKIVAHTDLVKCFSNEFPPIIDTNNNKANSDVLIENCKGFLKSQIKNFKPSIIICNGAPVSHYILKEFPPSVDVKSEKLLSYEHSFEGHSVWIFLSGFIGRIDDWSKRRLGVEIEEKAVELGFKL